MGHHVDELLVGMVMQVASIIFIIFHIHGQLDGPTIADGHHESDQVDLGVADAAERERSGAGSSKTFSFSKSLSRLALPCQGQRRQEKGCLQELEHSVAFV